MSASIRKDQITIKNGALLVIFLLAQTAALFFVKYGLHVKAPYFIMPFVTMYWLLGILCLAAQAVCWQKLLKSVDLSLAYAASSIFVIINLAVSRFAFAESVTLQHFIGGVLLCCGISIIVYSKKSVRDR